MEALDVSGETVDSSQSQQTTLPVTPSSGQQRQRAGGYATESGVPLKSLTTTWSTTARRPLDKEVLQALVDAVSAKARYEGDFANLAEVGHHLIKLSPDFNPRNYGYDKLREFIEASGLVDLRWKEMGDNPPIALVRIKKS